MKPYIYRGPIRLHLPDYNRASWKIEGKYIYTQFKSYEEYREYWKKAQEADDEIHKGNL